LLIGVGNMFRPLKGHHQAFYLKHVFKIRRILLGSLLFVNINGIPVMYAVF